MPNFMNSEWVDGPGYGSWLMYIATERKNDEVKTIISAYHQVFFDFSGDQLQKGEPSWGN